MCCLVTAIPPRDVSLASMGPIATPFGRQPTPLAGPAREGPRAPYRQDRPGPGPLGRLPSGRVGHRRGLCRTCAALPMRGPSRPGVALTGRQIVPLGRETPPLRTALASLREDSRYDFRALDRTPRSRGRVVGPVACVVMPNRN